MGRQGGLAAGHAPLNLARCPRLPYPHPLTRRLR